MKKIQQKLTTPACLLFLQTKTACGSETSIVKTKKGHASHALPLTGPSKGPVTGQPENTELKPFKNMCGMTHPFPNAACHQAPLTNTLRRSKVSLQAQHGNSTVVVVEPSLR